MECLALMMFFSCFQYLRFDCESHVSPAETVQATHRIFITIQRTNACTINSLYPKFAMLPMRIDSDGADETVLFLGNIIMHFINVVAR